MKTSLRVSLSLALAASCAYPPVDLEGRGPPCTSGFVAFEDRCVRVGLDVGVDVRLDAPTTCECVGGLVQCSDRPARDSACDGDALVLCTGEPASLTRVVCPAACNEVGDAAACALSPAFVPCDTPIVRGTGDVVLASGVTTIDTDDPTTIPWPGVTFTNVSQGAGEPGLLVVSMRSLRVERDATLRALPASSARPIAVSGIPGRRALVLLVETTVVVDGRVEISAAGELGGAGAVRTCCTEPGCSDGCGVAGWDRGFYDGGGGGGGHGGRGGAGGPAAYCGTCPASRDAGGVDGGVQCACDAFGLAYGRGGEPYVEAALIGGAPGGLGGLEGTIVAGGPCGPPDYPTGGGGGGAMSIVAGTSIRVSGTGALAAHGGGGGNGHLNNSGGGGGAGGTIVLESPYVSVGGRVTAHGGAGGTAGSYNTCRCPACDLAMSDVTSLEGHGEDGRDEGRAMASMPVLPGSDGFGVMGGDGSTVTSLDGESPTRRPENGNQDSGGGGGAAGHIVIVSLGVDGLDRTTPRADTLPLEVTCR